MNIKMKKMHFKGDDNRLRGMFGAWLTVFCLLVFPHVGRGEVKLPPVLGSHMVLQRDMPLPVWGTAAPNEEVAVEIVPSQGSGPVGQKKKAVADAKGKWAVKLDPMPACAQPLTLVVAGKSGKKVISDVLVGDVWVGSGQSNMQMGGGSYTNHFDHVGQGLAFKHGEKLQGFAVSGADSKFVWADAVIEQNTVVLSSDKVAKPVAVRYAWANQHRWANLFNQDGLPALPFRTDVPVK